jgi:glycerol uptake facilitator-like aquaporin
MPGAGNRADLARRIIAEAVGTGLLLAAIIGSGIIGERLAGGNVAIAVLANTLATGAALLALILPFGPISGAHFNPAVTLADASQGGVRWRDVPAHIAAQLVGAFAGVGAAHLISRRHSSLPRAMCERARRAAIRWGRGDLRLAGGDLGVRPQSVERRRVRGFSVYYRGLLVHLVHLLREPGRHARARGKRYLCRHSPGGDAPGFVIAQLVGAAAATALFRWLVSTLPHIADQVVVPPCNRGVYNASRFQVTNIKSLALA